MSSCADTKAWVRALGLKPKASGFNIGVFIGTTPKVPTSLITKKAIMVTMSVMDVGWSVHVYERGALAGWSRDENRPIYREVDQPGWRRLELRVKKPSLATLPSWLAEVGAELGVTFRLDRAAVSSDVAGAARAIRGWLAV